MKKVKRLSVLFVLLLATLLAACSDSGNKSSDGSSSKTSSDGKTLFIGLVNPPISFNPINSGDFASQWLEKFMFETFLEMTAPLEFTPKLAESFETEDNQTYTIKLQPKATWSDGEPVTAEDIAFTFNLIANPKTETSVGTIISNLEGLDENGKLTNGEKEMPSITVVDEKTFTFKTKQPVDPNLIKEFIGSQIMILPKHILKDVAPEDLTAHPFMQNPNVTNGAFKFVKYEADQYVEFAKNDNYYVSKPKLDKIFVKIMPATNLVAQLQTGEIHMNAGVGLGSIAVSDYDTVEKIKGIHTTANPANGYQTLLFNTKKITDPNVRVAIGHAINRDQMIKSLLQGKGDYVDGPYPSINPYYDSSIKNISYDPEKAKEMLKAANWDFNTPLEIAVPAGNKMREQAGAIILENLKAIGLNVQLVTSDFPTHIAKARERNYDLMILGYTTNIDPDITNYYGNDSPFNFTGYQSEEKEKLLLAGNNEPNPEKRKAIYSKLQALFVKDLPVFTLYSEYDFAAISDKVISAGPTFFGYHNNLQDWDLSDK
ncbi:ABC transporter substrate-binding protein [Psychrobacillus sp. L4]|uniref:ABC transporter substrate-binding protein n=1 Tax=Psychrobacillus sp. L4 TaxID=3236892 RepID=UPI0036F196AB